MNRKAFVALTLAILAAASGRAQTAAPTTTPRPTPAATAAPAPQRPVPMPVAPPLSLSDCQAILSDAAQVVGTDPTTAERMIASVENYLKFRDDLHTSLASYQWPRLRSAKVENDPGTVDRDTFRFDPPVERISALGFEAEGGDVWLHTVRVYDENNALRDTHRFDKPRLLQQMLPRREVFHLWRRTTISRIEVEYSSANPGPQHPRVSVLGGTTAEREYIKTAIYHLGTAADAVRQGKAPVAGQALTAAQREISAYITRRQRD